MTPTERSKLWRQQNPEKYIEGYKKRNSRLKGQKQNKNTYLQRNYGLNLEEFTDLLNKQNGKCWICGLNEITVDNKNKPRTLCVDHCHKTGKVRGLLCNLCNRGLGYFKDNTNNLEKAIEYLKNS